MPLPFRNGQVRGLFVHMLANGGTSELERAEPLYRSECTSAGPGKGVNDGQSDG